ncbi:hypothetical protein MHAE_16666 [Mycobacterium haemophilum DSM 44634]|uniref:hypothetical protein n=1 Tax=Mycobacterium haemophilum TaxID=29311 RepID=UPI000654E30C|nr:hypothetical protein [Mycobacterium haemophilum]AKN17317.1 hypothetical protein B586_13240 [Mycobacterium haemophilum DSM 44634]MCV7340060.1 hypothetical protein [Mycobacterium haemophilum DSM 44634]
MYATVTWLGPRFTALVAAPAAGLDSSGAVISLQCLEAQRDPGSTYLCGHPDHHGGRRRQPCADGE